MNEKTYYIGFFKYQDTTIWSKTNLYVEKKNLETYLETFQYIDKSTIIIKEITLPN